LNAGDRLFDRFVLLAPLGAGGVASVWKARDEQLGQEVALKVLHPHLRSSPVVCQRFRREVEIGRRLEHPVIVRTLDLYENAEHLLFSMELLQGSPLRALITERGQLGADEVRALAMQILDGLAAAHDAGIVHRDLTAQNVFLCDTGAVKLLDFGFARVADATGLSTRSVLMCTPEYAAPEVIRGRKADSRADLYSLGVILFEAATGRLPFQGASAFDLLQKQIEEAVPDPREHRPGLPGGLASVIVKLIAKEPAARFDTCLAVQAALDDPGLVRMLSRPGKSAVCIHCGHLRETALPFCLHCAQRPAAVRRGRWMAVLTRTPDRPVTNRLRDLLIEVGCLPRPWLHVPENRRVRGLPRVLVKGVDRLVAERLRERALEEDLQVELRSFDENNSDLLHKSNTPSYLFLLALMLPWGLLVTTTWLAYYHLGEMWAFPFFTLMCAGPFLVAWLFKRAHDFLPAMASVPKTSQRKAENDAVEALRQELQGALQAVRDESLQADMRRLVRLGLKIELAVAAGGSARGMKNPTALARALVKRGLLLTRKAQELADRMKLVDEGGLVRRMEDLSERQRRQEGETGGADALKRMEAALAHSRSLEQAYQLCCERLLRAISTLELSSVELLVAGAPPVPRVSVLIDRLRLETEVVLDTARAMQALDQELGLEELEQNLELDKLLT